MTRWDDASAALQKRRLAELEELERIAIRLREASIAASKNGEIEDLIRSHAEWIRVDAEFREIVDRLRARRRP